MDNPTINIWLDNLLKTTNKTTFDDLTEQEILVEIEDVEGTISNERLWAHADSIHEENIAVLVEYLEVLNELKRRTNYATY